MNNHLIKNSIKKSSDKLLQVIKARKAAKAGRVSIIGIVDMNQETIRKWLISESGISEYFGDDEPSALIPERLERMIFPKRFKVIYGGRASTKTRSAASIAIELSSVKHERVVCFRETMQSIETSTYQELVDDIARKDLSKFFRITYNKIKGLTKNSSFSFSGLLRNQ